MSLNNIVKLKKMLMRITFMVMLVFIILSKNREDPKLETVTIDLVDDINVYLEAIPKNFCTSSL